jgi:MFS family permease
MSEPAANRRSPTFASLANRNYRTYFFSQAFSLTGTWMQSVALAWLVLTLTGSATWLGLAIALQTLPVLLLGPYGGLLVDRTDKRRLLMGTQTAAAVQALALGVLTVTGTVTLGWVLVLSVGLGLINSVDNPGRQAFVREMVPVEMVRNAVSLNAVLVNVARAVGPAIAGVLIATAGLGTCFLVNAASFVVVIGAYAVMNRSELRPTEPVPRGPGQLKEGLRYVRSDPHLLVPLLMMALVGTLTYEFQISLPALATGTFNGGAGSLGAVTAAMGVGAVIGGLISAGRPGSGIRTMTAAAATFGGTVLLVVCSPTLVTAAAALVAVGAASIWFLSTGNATLQLAAAPEMRGRVMALWTVAFIGTTPIGGPVIGFVAEHAGPRWALALGATAALLAAGLGAVALRRLARRPIGGAEGP